MKTHIQSPDCQSNKCDLRIFSMKGFKHLSPFQASGHFITRPAHMPEVSYTSVKKECFKGHHHLHFVSIQHVVTPCMQNRCTVCSTEALHIGCPAPSLFHLQTSPTGTATGTPPLQLLGLQPITAHLRFAAEARQGGVFSADVYLSSEGEIEGVRDKGT